VGKGWARAGETEGKKKGVVFGVGKRGSKKPETDQSKRNRMGSDGWGDTGRQKKERKKKGAKREMAGKVSPDRTWVQKKLKPQDIEIAGGGTDGKTPLPLK